MVTFPPGMRTFWHRHTKGQTLHVFEGEGWVQLGRANRPQRVRLGDLVRIDPDQEHWHGATATTSLRHLAVTAGTTRWQTECPVLPE